MAALRLCSLLIVALTAAQYCMLHAAPTQDLSNVNRNFRTGSLITERYALSLNELMASSDNSVSQTVVNTFCNLLSYYEMMKVTEVNSSGNGTDANGTSADSLSYLQVLVRQNLQDTCHWISLQVAQGTINPTDPRLFDDDSCSLNDTTILRGACLRHRVVGVTSAALSVALTATGPVVHNLNPCQWVRRLGPTTSDHITHSIGMTCA